MILKDMKKRYCLIDSIRGFALLNMILFHLLYDIFEIYGQGGWAMNTYVAAWERFICCSFIIISGISFNFSHHAYKRGIIISLCGFLVTIVTVAAIPSQAVWFGILNLLGCCMLIAQPLRVYLEKIRPIAGMAVSFVIFMLTYAVPRGYIGIFDFRLIALPDFLYGCKYLSFLGFKSADFHSTDYFPIIPWIFLFIFGYFLWRFISQRGYDKYFVYKVPVLDILGRYSLWIYLAHQPIIMAVLMIIYG